MPAPRNGRAVREDDHAWEARAWSAAVVMLLLGVAVTGAALLWPVQYEYQIDPTLSATVNERLQDDNDKLVFTIGVVTLFGMTLVTCGGLVTSFIFCRNVVLKELNQSTRKEVSSQGPRDVTSLVGPGGFQMQEFALGNRHNGHSYRSFEDPGQYSEFYQPYGTYDISGFESTTALDSNTDLTKR